MWSSSAAIFCTARTAIRPQTRFRRSFVGHYANARSFTQWGYGDGDVAGTNHKHILARGFTHLPFGLPRFGTACAANTPSLRGIAGGDGAAHDGQHGRWRHDGDRAHGYGA